MVDERPRLLLRVCLDRTDDRKTSVVRARKTSHENPLDNRARVRRARDATVHRFTVHPAVQRDRPFCETSPPRVHRNTLNTTRSNVPHMCFWCPKFHIVCHFRDTINCEKRCRECFTDDRCSCHYNSEFYQEKIAFYYSWFYQAHSGPKC